MEMIHLSGMHQALIIINYNNNNNYNKHCGLNVRMAAVLFAAILANLHTAADVEIIVVGNFESLQPIQKKTCNIQ